MLVMEFARSLLPSFNDLPRVGDTNGSAIISSIDVQRDSMLGTNGQWWSVLCSKNKDGLPAVMGAILGICTVNISLLRHAFLLVHQLPVREKSDPVT